MFCNLLTRPDLENLNFSEVLIQDSKCAIEIKQDSRLVFNFIPGIFVIPCMRMKLF